MNNTRRGVPTTRGDLRRVADHVAQLLDIVGAQEVFSDDLLNSAPGLRSDRRSQRLRDRDRGTLPAGPSRCAGHARCDRCQCAGPSGLVGRATGLWRLCPPYQQHYSIPASIRRRCPLAAFGRGTRLLLPDLDELRALVGTTQTDRVQQSEQWTGSLMDEATLGQITEIARRSGPTSWPTSVPQAEPAGFRNHQTIADIHGPDQHRGKYVEGVLPGGPAARVARRALPR